MHVNSKLIERGLIHYTYMYVTLSVWFHGGFVVDAWKY